MTAAYATWNFAGKPGVKDLSGLVCYRRRRQFAELPTAAEARGRSAGHRHRLAVADLLQLGLPLGFRGVQRARFDDGGGASPTGARSCRVCPFPNSPKPPVPATNVGQYGYSVNVGTSPEFLALVQSHIGQPATSGDPAVGRTAAWAVRAGQPKSSPRRTVSTEPLGITRAD